MYDVELSKKAQKQLNSLPTLAQVRIRTAIDSLSINPRPPGVKALKNTKGLLRLRAGDYRVIYQVEDNILLVLIVEVGHRREIYRKK